MEDIERINFSYKIKDKSQFLDNISSVYQHVLRNSINKVEIKQNDSFQDGGILNISNKSLYSKNSSPPYGKKITRRSLTFENLNCLNFNFSMIKNLEDISLSSLTTNDSLNAVLHNPIISKNLNIVDDVLKLMVIGDQKVGKSFFINKIFNKKDNLMGELSYSHTNSLDIKKKISSY